jgi:hypothetical protein
MLLDVSALTSTIKKPDTYIDKDISLKIQPGLSKKVSDPDVTLTQAIGLLTGNQDIHFYSYGNFNLVRLILYLIKQTGPAHIFMCSYSFSQQSIEAIQKRIEKKEILSFRVIIDHRVKTMSPKPFQMLSTSFDYRCTAIHAKIALLWNDHWHLSIVTSQNATIIQKSSAERYLLTNPFLTLILKPLKMLFEHGTT